MLQNLTIDQLPQSNQPQPIQDPIQDPIQEPIQEPIQNQESPESDHVSVDDFLADTFEKAKVSADTPIDADTGAPDLEAEPTSPGSARAELSKADAAAQTKRMMQARDMIQARLLAFIAKDPDRWKEFKLDQWEFDWLCEAYADTFQRMGKIPAWLDIVLAEAVVMGPRIMNATKYRKLEIENERLKRRIKKFEGEKATARPDTKTMWQIDNDGFFVYDGKGKYIKQADRRIKPGLSEAEYQLLIKHNDKDQVDQIFEI